MKEERRKQTEQKLIECGEREFLEKGYAKANLREICKSAGVTTGAFYFSFENKEALLAACLLYTSILPGIFFYQIRVFIH